MPKVPKILNEIEKLIIISFFMANTVPLGVTSIEKLIFKKKARLFVFENRLLIIIKINVKKNYICEHETSRMREDCNLFRLYWDISPRFFGPKKTPPYVDEKESRK
ncbi:hypothetical protein CDIK_1126 [Cucumispora dikerogammari]|nr:hypothetical protein CDIK_1126 [Cucumispora dikerogammari]